MLWDLARAMKARMSESTALLDWVKTSGLTKPRIVIGYDQPRNARDWPFIAIVPLRAEFRVTVRPRPTVTAMGLVCGVRWESSADDGEGGMAQVYRLQQIVIEEYICRPLESLAHPYVARLAQLTDYELVHPNYQLEWVMEFISN